MMKQTVLLLLGVYFVGVCAAVDIFQTISCCECRSMMPTSISSNVQPQINPSPFRIEVVEGQEYKYLEEIQVNLTASDPTLFLQSFMIQARRLDAEQSRDEPIGTFIALDKVDVVPSCTGTGLFGSALVSNDNRLSNHIRLVWNPPKNYQGHIEFRATFVQDAETFWVREKSSPVLDPIAPALPRHLYIPVLPPSIDPIDTRECGVTKGCYREPHGCWEPYCEYIVTFEDMGNGIKFELGAQLDGLYDRYVALALSDDIRMGDDLVMECVHNGSTGEVNVYQSINSKAKHNKRLNNPSIGIFGAQGQYRNGRIRCRFTKSKNVDDEQTAAFSLSKPWHLMVGKGFAHKGAMLRHGLSVGELPIVSPDKVSLQGTPDFGGRASYPLVKAHACLMILAWIFFANLGLMLAKYYKPMWPNSRFLGERYWFVAHFNCMAWLCLAVVIAFILIFIEAGGYSQAPDLPQKAHPILGIIIFCCVIINPIIALIRPSEDSKWRPVFNWFHCSFGTIANCLAIPNIFIGMDFGKANIPWWSTWILVIYIIFHIIVEITLEVHQCCTHKKNKERRKKYELQKHENPKAYTPEPEPAGRRFKRFMLALHFTVTCIVTVLMIIIIAVA